MVEYSDFAVNSGPWTITGNDIENSNSGNIIINGDILPHLGGGGTYIGKLGNSIFRVVTAQLQGSSGFITVFDDLIPFITDDISFGTSTKVWKSLYVNTIYNAKHAGDWLPTTNGTVDLGSTTAEWNKVYANTIVGAKHEGDWLPTTNGIYNLGDPLTRWKTIYTDEVKIGSTLKKLTSSGSSIICSSHFIPEATNSNDLGSSSLKWDNLYIAGDINIGNTEKIYDGGSTRIYINSHFDPDINDAFDVGGSGLRFRKIFLTNQPDVGSDRRLKENIQPVSYGLKEVLNLNPVSFNLISDEAKQKQLGFLAQELKRIYLQLFMATKTKKCLALLTLNSSPSSPKLFRSSK
ncbi:MAG: tail fiber domain-containing protein [Saprospiraceae bacterium]|nr:tail fiber domain-containing protein [Candidatus Brachybacter algidus]MBK8746969.1 tail fiber domain-containing protein [Candidatus Brachybacter algidus]